MDDPVPIRVRWCRHALSGIPRECALGIDVEDLITKQIGAERYRRYFASPCHDDSHESVFKASCKDFVPRKEVSSG